MGWCRDEAGLLRGTRTAVRNRLRAVGTRLRAIGTRLRAIGARLRAIGTRLGAIGARLRAVRRGLLGPPAEVTGLSELRSRLATELALLSPEGTRLPRRPAELTDRVRAVGRRLAAVRRLLRAERPRVGILGAKSLLPRGLLPLGCLPPVGTSAGGLIQSAHVLNFSLGRPDGRRSRGFTAFILTNHTESFTPRT